MKVQLYCNDGVEPEKVVTVKLTKSPVGVVMIAVDSLGHEIAGGRIATLTHDGCLIIHSNLEPSLGLQTVKPRGGISINFG